MEIIDAKVCVNPPLQLFSKVFGDFEGSYMWKLHFPSKKADYSSEKNKQNLNQAYI